MQARDAMVSPVITVDKMATVRDVGKVIGIVTESDLMRRTEAGTERPYSWWVRFLAGDATVAADYVKSHATRIQDVMTTASTDPGLIEPHAAA